VVRPLDGLDPIELPDTLDALPSWSPDSRSVVRQQGPVVRMPIDGGKAVALGQVPVDMNGSGATCWLADGASSRRERQDGHHCHPDRGGDATPIADIDKQQEIDFHEKQLPGGGVIQSCRADTTRGARQRQEKGRCGRR
jgi:hypothetical protein